MFKNVTKKKSRLKLDFRTKLFTTVVLSYVLLLGNLQQKFIYVVIAASVLPYILFIIDGKYKQGIQNMIFIIIAAVLQQYFLYHVTGILTSLLLFMVMISIRMLPGVAMGSYTFLTTDIGEIVYSLGKMKLPDQVIIPMTVMARFFYTTKSDYNQIRDAMYMHGLIKPKMLLNPMKMFEYRFVPLMMLLMRTADEVSVSALTRGLEVGKKRSSIHESKFKLIDYFFFILMFILIAFYIGGKYAGN